MAASGSRRVVRALMEEEEELMDIDSAQGSTQKRSNGKVKETTEAHSKKKSKGVEIAVVTIP
jgi:predicted transcriptional regulator